MLSLGINLSVHDLDTENHKPLLKMSKEDPDKWRDVLRASMGRKTQNCDSVHSPHVGLLIPDDSRQNSAAFGW